jgi:dATP pyrophosphohydrolase
MTAHKQPVSVLVVIYTAELDVLLLERAAHPGFWQSVTGSRESNESMLTTASREVREETGLDVNQYKLDDWQKTNQYEIFTEWRHRYAPGVTQNTEHVFGLLLSDRQPVSISPAEHRQWRWAGWREAADACFSASNREAILELPARLAMQNHPPQ